MPERFNVLISSVGRRGELVRIFQATLREMGLEGKVFGADMSALAPAAYLTDETFLVPRCTDPSFVDVMLRICEEQAVRLVVPTIDTELPALAENRQRFEKIGCFVHISDPRTIQIAYRKDRTHQWLEQEGLPTVKQAPAGEVLAGKEAFDFPAIAKPVAGSASIGVTKVSDMEELRFVAARGDYVVQSIAPGVEFTVSVFVDQEGKVRTTVPRQRLEVRAGEVSKGRTVHVAPVEDLARRLFERLPGARGAMNVQIFFDEQSGAVNVIEINPRFGGGFPLAWHAGARSPRWIIEEILGLESSITDEWKEGLTMLRFDDAVYLTPEDVARMEKQRV